MNSQCFLALWAFLSSDPLSLLLQVLLALIAIACSTRFITGKRYNADIASTTSPQRPAVLPYWIPYLGHLNPLLSNPELFLQSLSSQSLHGIVSLKVFGARYSIICNPNLIKDVFEDSASLLTFDAIRWNLLVNVFGAAKTQKQAYANVHDEARACLSKGPSPHDWGLDQIANAIITEIQESTPNLVSFSDSTVDLYPWERTASPSNPPVSLQQTKPNTPAVEVNLFALVSTFVAHTALRCLVGTDFADLFPSTLDDLRDLDAAFFPLALGIPRWVPLPSLNKAHLARSRLLTAIDSFHLALDKDAQGERPDDPWRDVSDASPLMKQRSAIWRAHAIPPVLKASLDLNLIWAITTKPTPLVFWTLLHISSKPGLPQTIREEILPHASATNPPRRFALPEPPRLTLHTSGLLRSCPLLRSCIRETLRLHSTSTTARNLKTPISVRERLQDLPRGLGAKTYALEPGSCLLAFSSSSSSPQRRRQRENRQGDYSLIYPSTAFDPERFLPSLHEKEKKKEKEKEREQNEEDDEEEEEEEHEEGGGGGGGAGPTAWGKCPGRSFAEKETAAFVAAILALWDFEIPSRAGEGGKSVVPGHQASSSATFVARPAHDVRVVVRARELSSPMM